MQPILWLLLPLLAASMTIQLKLSPLIGGPSFLPVHVKVVVANDHIYDFVPLNAADPETIAGLLRLKPVPGEIRSMGRKQNQSPIVEKADTFVNGYSNTDLHLVYNNCWTFALLMLWELLLTKEPNNDLTFP